MIDIPKILAPLPAMIRHQTDATCCVVLMRDLQGECHIVAEGKNWKSLVVAAAGRVLETATISPTCKDSLAAQEEVPND